MAAFVACDHREEFLSRISHHQTIILDGDIGSRKSTQVPQWSLEYVSMLKNGGVVACTQTSTVAAMALAYKISLERSTVLGEEVGYNVRFEDCASSRTVIRCFTDEVLLLMSMNDPLFKDFAVIIVDEAHLRTLASDVLLSVLRRVLQSRRSLRLVIMGSGLNTAVFSNYFEDAKVICLPKQTLNVEIRHTKPSSLPNLDDIIATIEDIDANMNAGDIVIFLADKEETDEARKRLQDNSRFECHQLHSSLPLCSLKTIFHPTAGQRSNRRVIFSTNVGETSLAINGLAYVIDSGFQWEKVYDPSTHMETVILSRISQASADRRVDIAGRSGKCIRMYDIDTYQQQMLPDQPPHILSSDLSAVVLKLTILNHNFNFISPPVPEALDGAREMLQYLKALDDSGQVTKHGRKLAALPLDPRLGHMLLSSINFGCEGEILIIVAMLCVPHFARNPSNSFESRVTIQRQFKLKLTGDDHVALLKVFNAFIENGEDDQWCETNLFFYQSLKSAVNIRQRLAFLMSDLLEIDLRILMLVLRTPYKASALEMIRRALVKGFFTNMAYSIGNGHYSTLMKNNLAELRSSTFQSCYPNWVIYSSLEVEVDRRVYIRQLTNVDSEWLKDWLSWLLRHNSNVQRRNLLQQKLKYLNR